MNNATNTVDEKQEISSHNFSAAHSLQEYAGVLAVGVILGIGMPLIAKINGHGNDALQELVKHALTIDKEAIGFSGLLGGVAVAFSGHPVSRMLASQVCASFLGLVAHAAALAAGLMFGLLIPIGLKAPDLPTSSSSTALGTGACAIVLFVGVYFFYLWCKGYFAPITSRKIFTNVWFCALSGLAISVISVIYMFHLEFSW